MNQSKKLSEKRQILKQKREQNERYVRQIKQLNTAISNLKWSIPEIGVKQEIQQLKQSIRIPLARSPENIESLQEQKKIIQSEVEKKQQSKIIKHLQLRKQILQKLQKLKPESNLYQSHRRVVLKEYLQKLREENQKAKQKNNFFENELTNVDLQMMATQYKEFVKELEKSMQKLDGSRLM